MNWFILAAKLLCTDSAFDRKTRLKALSGPSRFLLIRLMILMEGRTMGLRQSDIQKGMLLSEKVVRDGISELVATGILAEQSRSSSGKGRPLPSYKLSEKFIKSLADIQELGIRQFEGVIQHLLTASFPSEQTSKRIMRTRMSPFNRLLLAGMFARADEYGVLQSVSVADLSRVAGLSKDQFVSQMSKLGARGYIRRHVSGLSSSTMFGKARAWIYLNVMHPDFEEMGQPHWIVASPAAQGDLPRDVWELFRDSWRYIRLPGVQMSLSESWPPTDPPTELRASEVLRRHELGEYHQRWGWDRFSQLWGESKSRSSPALYAYLGDHRHQLAELIHAHVCHRASVLVVAALGNKEVCRLEQMLDRALISLGSEERKYWERVLAVGGKPPGQALVSAMMTLVREMGRRALSVVIRAHPDLPSDKGGRFQISILPPPVPPPEKGVEEHVGSRWRFALMIFPENGGHEDVGKCFVVDSLSQVRQDGLGSGVRAYKSEWELETAERREFGLELIPKEYPRKPPKETKKEP